MAEDFYFVPLDLALQFEPLAAERGVSRVARGQVESSTSRGGYLQAAKSVNGDIGRLKRMNALRNGTQTWWQRRCAFCARHRAQQRANDEPSVEQSGKYKGTPRRRELGLLMWQCSSIAPKQLREMLPRVRKVLNR